MYAITGTLNQQYTPHPHTILHLLLIKSDTLLYEKDIVLLLVGYWYSMLTSIPPPHASNTPETWTQYQVL